MFNNYQPRPLPHQASALVEPAGCEEIENRVATLTMRGRPRDPKKRCDLIEAGRELFEAGGLRPVTVEQVAAQAGVSRGTFYANFSDIDDLLEAVVRHQSDRIVEGLTMANLPRESLRDTLLRFGISLLTFLSDEKMQAFERRLTAEVETRPELALRFFHAGPARTRNRLVEVVAAAMERGDLVRENPAELVGDLIGLWQGFHRMELIFRAIPQPEPQELVARATRGVDLFLKLYGCRTLPSEPGASGGLRNERLSATD